MTRKSKSNRKTLISKQSKQNQSESQLRQEGFGHTGPPVRLRLSTRRPQGIHLGSRATHRAAVLPHPGEALKPPGPGTVSLAGLSSGPGADHPETTLNRTLGHRSESTVGLRGNTHIPTIQSSPQSCGLPFPH